MADPTLKEMLDAERERTALRYAQIDAAGGAMLLDGDGEAPGLLSYVEDDPETHFADMTPEQIAALQSPVAE